MTPEQQRIAIAEACGWKREGDDGWISPLGNYHQEMHRFADKYGEPLPPDYLSDLNAMHEAEKSLTREGPPERWQTTRYYDHLSSICADSGTNTWAATAAQRAEAFIRTLDGAWQEDSACDQPGKC